MSRKRVILLVCAAIIFVALVGFYAYVNLRAGPDYTEELAALLPPDTALYLSLRDLASLLDQIKGYRIYRDLQAGPELMDYLLSTKRWRNIDRRLDKFEQKTRLKITERFLKRWFGRHVVFATLTGDELNPPATLILSKTGIGFEENLAEFLAHLYPELHLETERYRGVTINTYLAKKERNAFSYLRFGRTVVVSLRSSDASVLKHVVDLKEDRQRRSLAELEAFRSAFQGREKESGIIAYASPRGVVSLVFSGSKAKQKVSLDQLETFQRAIEAIEYVSASIRLDKGLAANLRIAYPAAASEVSKPTSARALNYLPAETLGFVIWRSPSLAESLAYVLNIVDEYSLAHGDTPLSQQIEDSVGINLYNDVLPLTGSEAAISLRSIKPFIAYPVLQGQILLQTPQAAKTQSLWKRLIKSALSGTPNSGLKSLRVGATQVWYTTTPFGTFRYYAADRDYVIFDLDENIPRKNVELYEKAGIRMNERYELLKKRLGESADILAFFDFEVASKALTSVSQNTLAWKQKQRRRLDSYKKLADVLRYARAAMLTADANADGISARLAIPLE